MKIIIVAVIIFIFSMPDLSLARGQEGKSGEEREIKSRAEAFNAAVSGTPQERSRALKYLQTKKKRKSKTRRDRKKMPEEVDEMEQENK
jgi:hypothetical protein